MKFELQAWVVSLQILRVRAIADKHDLFAGIALFWDEWSTKSL